MLLIFSIANVVQFDWQIKNFKYKIDCEMWLLKAFFNSPSASLFQSPFWPQRYRVWPLSTNKPSQLLPNI